MRRYWISIPCCFEGFVFRYNPSYSVAVCVKVASTCGHYLDPSNNCSYDWSVTLTLLIPVNIGGVGYGFPVFGQRYYPSLQSCSPGYAGCDRASRGTRGVPSDSHAMGSHLGASRIPALNHRLSPPGLRRSTCTAICFNGCPSDVVILILSELRSCGENPGYSASFSC